MAVQSLSCICLCICQSVLNALWNNTVIDAIEFELSIRVEKNKLHIRIKNKQSNNKINYSRRSDISFFSSYIYLNLILRSKYHLNLCKRTFKNINISKNLIKFRKYIVLWTNIKLKCKADWYTQIQRWLFHFFILCIHFQEKKAIRTEWTKTHIHRRFVCPPAGFNTHAPV